MVINVMVIAHLLVSMLWIAEASLFEHVFRDEEKSSDLRLLYGGMFADTLVDYTHWGWVDVNCIYGDLSDMVSKLGEFDVVTYPNDVCLWLLGIFQCDDDADVMQDYFAIYLSHHLTVFRNIEFFRRFFAVRYYHEKLESLTSIVELLLYEDGDR